MTHDDERLSAHHHPLLPVPGLVDDGLDVQPPLRPPPLALLLAEDRVPAELGELWSTMPHGSRLPRGDGHPVLVLPGLAMDNLQTAPLRCFLQLHLRHRRLARLPADREAAVRKPGGGVEPSRHRLSIGTLEFIVDRLAQPQGCWQRHSPALREP